MSDSLIDIGVNLSNNRFKDDVEEVLKRAQKEGVGQLILTGTSIADTMAVIDLCDKFDQQFPNMLYATAGVHPHHANEYDNQALSSLDQLAEHNKSNKLIYSAVTNELANRINTLQEEHNGN